MSPIDDELRAALQGRAQALAPSPDPLSGIERRAKRIQRNRIGGAVAGSVLAVGLVAAVVPAIQTSATSQRDVPRVAQSTPPEPSPVLQTSAYALDPQAPWPYRGDPQLAVQGDLDAYTVQWAAEHRVLTDDVDMTLLFGQVYEPSTTPEVVYVVTQRSTGQHWWGVGQATESGPQLLVDQRLPSPALSLAAALPGDEGDRLLVVASPELGAIEYGEQASEYRPLARLADGVATGPLDAPADRDVYRVLDRDGREVDAGDAPDLQEAPDEGPGTEQPSGDPATALDPASPWELRGDAALLEDRHVEGIASDFASRRGIDAGTVEVVPLYVQDAPEDAEVEVAYLVRAGDGPWIWGVSALLEGRWWWYAEKRLEPGTEALVATIPRDGDQSAVLVVSAPSNGGAVFARPGGSFQPMEDLAPGVFGALIAGDVEDTRYKVLDGDGDFENPVAEGEVPPFQNAG
jgi:hypothetical protein